MPILRGGILVVAAVGAVLAWQLAANAHDVSDVTGGAARLTGFGSSASTSPSPSPSPSSPAPTPSGFVSCSVTYTVLNSWPGSFEVQITIANTGPVNITPWVLTWTFAGDQQITKMSNATYSQSGEHVTASNVSYDAEISVNSAIGIGVDGTYTNSDAAPRSFALNGTACTA